MDTDTSRREFIRLVSGAGAALVASCGSAQKTNSGVVLPNRGVDAVVPKRLFGHTGVRVSKLCLGGSSVVGTDSRSLLDEALRHGIDCWEFNPFCGRAFGDYFKTHPGLRERVFLSAKTKSTAPAAIQEDLHRTLTENETSVVDFFAIHGVDDVEVLTDDVRRWAEKAKEEGKIRFFGFCTHKRVDSCLARATEIGWIDGIQAFYNYRMQATGSMETALRKCHEKGIGIFTVKSMGLCIDDEAKLQGLPLPKDKLLTLLTGHGLSFEKAKLKAIWQNPCVASVCSLMPSVAIMRANASAAMDERPLNGEVVKLLADYANGTGRYFCSRCGTCETATQDRIPIFNVMESLMYARGYGSRDLAAKIFGQIPVEVRNKMMSSDYSKVESKCPQRMPIAQLMREAYLELNG
jgi:predicted aldo/keto reductase-like oxidoreductase